MKYPKDEPIDQDCFCSCQRDYRLKIKSLAGGRTVFLSRNARSNIPNPPYSIKVCRPESRKKMTKMQINFQENVSDGQENQTVLFQHREMPIRIMPIYPDKNKKNLWVFLQLR